MDPLIVIGDSMTAVWPDKWLQPDLVGVDVQNYGAGGTTSLQAEAALDVALSRYPGADVVPWTGHNDANPAKGKLANVVPAMTRIAAKVNSGGGNLFVLGLSSSPIAPIGSALYGELTAVNEGLKALAVKEPGVWYFDALRYLVNSAMGDLGLETTEQDRRDIVNGIPPSTLRVRWGNPGHLDPATGKVAIGRRVARWLARVGGYTLS